MQTLMSLVDDPGGRSLAGIAGSNPATGMFVCLCKFFLRRDDHPVQKSPKLYIVSDCVRARNLGPRRAVEPQKKEGGWDVTKFYPKVKPHDG